ncbi:YlcI/YnfO family protein [Burkholderia anthina]|uniref:YlcI/YnfO family protein n=1 Tax=Burkholderia anthina TaxID=179879 RepID=UPI0037BE2751
MKATTMSTLRVDRTLLEAAETVLAENETLSAFVESTLRDAIARRRLRHEFVTRGLASAGEYVDAAKVHAKLGTMLKAARAAAATD